MAGKHRKRPAHTLRTVRLVIVGKSWAQYTTAVAATQNDWDNDNGHDGYGWHVSFSHN